MVEWSLSQADKCKSVGVGAVSERDDVMWRTESLSVRWHVKLTAYLAASGLE